MNLQRKFVRGGAGSRRAAFGAAALVVAGFAGSVNPAAAAINHDIFSGRVGRSVTTELDRPKATCVCQDGSYLHRRAGVLLQYPGSVGNGNEVLDVLCMVPQFDPATGAVAAISGCQTFVTLPK